MLTNYVELIERAYKESWAIVACHTSNLEMSRAIIEAAEELESPVIIQTSERAINYAGLREITSLIMALAESVRIPVILNLDHGHSYEIAEHCVVSGYTAVMRDGSDLTLQDNIAETKRVVDIAHDVGIGAEGELGPVDDVADSNTSHKMYTDPEEAMRFISETQVDLFVPTIGNAHGYISREQMSIKHLEKIKKITRGTPLVLDGSSGVSTKDIKTAIRFGVVKINVDTDLRFAFSESLRKNLRDEKTVFDPRGILGPAKDAVKAVVKEKIILFGSSGKAR